jgi:plastocyanin
MVSHSGQRRMTVGAALIATLCLLLVSGTRAAPRNGVDVTRTVTIKQSGPAPKTLTIAVDTTVRWINATTSPRRVTADGNAFPAFSLGVGASHTYRFPRTGRYPYRVDNRLQGTIVVVAGGSSGGSSSSSGGSSSSCTSSCEFHYAVSIKGVRTYKELSNDSPATTGREEMDLDWTAQVADMKVSLFTLGGKPEVIGDGKGTAHASLRFLESRPVWSGACQGTASADPAIELSLASSSGSNLRVDVNGVSSVFDEAARKAERAACPGGGPTPGTIPGTAGPPATVGPSTTSISLSDLPGPYRTVWFVSTSDLLRIGIERKNGTATDYPIDRIRAGEAFTLELRVLTRIGKGCSGLTTCTTRDTLHYTLTFTPK